MDSGRPRSGAATADLTVPIGPTQPAVMGHRHSDGMEMCTHFLWVYSWVKALMCFSPRWSVGSEAVFDTGSAAARANSLPVLCTVQQVLVHSGRTRGTNWNTGGSLWSAGNTFSLRVTKHWHKVYLISYFCKISSCAGSQHASSIT